jgi:hypothetical protein
LSSTELPGVLIDEDVPDLAADELAAQGYRVIYSREVVGRSFDDDKVADYALEHALIVVTRNIRDFRALARQRNYRRMSYIGLAGWPEQAPGRLRELHDVIGFLITRCATRGLRLNMEITSETFSVKDR